jgi:hypothetical protein
VPQNLGAPRAAGKPRTPQLTLQQLLSSPEDVQAAALQQLSLGNIGLPAAPHTALHAARSSAANTAGPSGAEAGEAGDAGTWGQVGYAAEWLQPASAQHAGLTSQHHRDTADAAWAPERPITGVAGARSASQFAPANLQHSGQQGSSRAGAAAAGIASVNQLNKGHKSVQGDATGSSSRSSAATAPTYKGTAAFKGSSRAQASLAGRFSTALQADLPGPGQFRPLHTVLDKHVQTVSFAPKSSKAAPLKHPAGAGDPQQAGPDVSQLPQQGRQQQARLSQDAAAGSGAYRVSTGYRDSLGAGEAGRRSSMCTVGSTPRSAAAADEDVVRAGSCQQPQQQQQQQGGKPRQQAGGTAAFKTVSRDQRAAVGAGRAAMGSASNSSGCDQQQQQQHEQQDGTSHHDGHAWSSSRGQE